MRAVYCQAIFAIGIFLSAGESSHAAVSSLQLVASGLVSPVFATYAPGDRDRLFIVERTLVRRCRHLQAQAPARLFPSQ
jgi:hypothetical protein